MGSEEVKQIVLAKIGLTDDELRDFLRKLTVFYISLTEKEQKAFRATTSVSEEEAVKAFGGEITAKELEKFIKSREPKGLGAKPLMLFECGGHHGGGD
ncbi:MAG: hypothetical protein ABSF54_25355 [Bryobacteraceae bacterium]